MADALIFLAFGVFGLLTARPASEWLAKRSGGISSESSERIRKRALVFQRVLFTVWVGLAVIAVFLEWRAG